MLPKIALSIVLLALAACAGPVDLRGSKPDLDEVTNIPPERVAGCVGDKFESAFTGFGTTVKFSTRPTSNGYSISGDEAGPMLFGGTDTILLVDIAKLESNTRVQLFTHIIAGQGKWISLVKGCLGG